MLRRNLVQSEFNPTTPVTIENCLYKTYLIGAMETPGKNDEGKGWRKTLSPSLLSRGIYCFDPTKEEAQKVGMETKDLMLKLQGWQQSGNWGLFLENMRKVWRGVTRIQSHPQTGEAQLVHFLGDIDYVKHANFLIWTLHEGDKLGGTIAELTLAFYFYKPVYLVTEVAKSTINKSLLYFVLDSGEGKGKIFKTYGELLSFLDGEYKLTVIGE